MVVGIDVYAVTIGVSGFFAGLALGAWLFGQVGDRVSVPLRLYALLEIGIAGLGVAATWGLAAAPELFVTLRSTIGPLAWGLPFLLVAIPATLMGGTLPPLLAALRPADASIGRFSGELYAANTAGAIVGALLTILLIVPAAGIRGAAWIAAAINVTLALLALVLAVRERRVTDASGSPSGESTAVAGRADPDQRLARLLYALAGGIALGYEVVWTQVIVQFLSTRAVAFGMVLAVYLLGLVIGSWGYARFADDPGPRWTRFGVLIAGAGIAALLSFTLLGPWLPAAQKSLGDAVQLSSHSRMLAMCARFALAAGVLILPSTLLLGAAFPAAARLAVRSAHAGRDVGYVLAVNTACGIVGTVVTGFVLVPALGLAGSLGALATLAAVLGAAAITRQNGFARPSLIRAAALIGVVALGAWMVPHDRLATLLAEQRGGEVVYYDEGPGGTVAVIEKSTAQGRFHRLFIQGVSNSGDVMSSKRYMRLQALLPLIVHPGEPRSALVIAFGTGITAGSLLAYPELEQRRAVELLEPVVAAAPLFSGNFNAGADQRLDIVIGDGRHELMRNSASYDLITLEPPPPAAAGVVNLYSREFYELARRRLNQDGLLAQWLPIATQNDEDTQSLVRSMLDVFPCVTLWSTEVHEMMLIGSGQPLKFDYAAVARRMAPPVTANALAEIGIETPADLLATYITDQAGLARYAAAALPVTDDRPRIEYAPWVRTNEILDVLPKLLELSSPLSVKASPEQLAAINRSYDRLIGFYEIVWYSYQGNRDDFARSVAEFRRTGWPNAYYDWYFTTGAKR